MPISLLGYYLIPKVYKNYWLLLVSLIFFAWGGVSYTIILVISILLNYFFGIKIEKNIETSKARTWLAIGVSSNILMLIVFKYTNFIVENINNVLDIVPINRIPDTHIILPIGISFYTFHSLSYLIDIYRRKSLAQYNIFDLSLYICMFSQLIAGPIIRYSDVWKQLRQRTHNIIKFSSGIERFLIGLGKKVLLANSFALIADGIFVEDISNLGALNAWLGIAAYTLQIYCDFSGYSDMAIGLGRMFGFEFLENFNYPYMATSVKDFWRRWHISLSTFFRDYVYIPLGGNRDSTGRTYLNLLIVFFLTGFWHGASWSFVVWGLVHGLFMLIERLGFEKILHRIWRPFSNLYTLLVVMLAWVLFRSDTLLYALDYWKAMFNFHISNEEISTFFSYMNLKQFLVFCITIPGIFGLYKAIGSGIEKYTASERLYSSVLSYSYHIISLCFYTSLLIVCSIYLTANTYNPFIYYRF